MKYNTILFDLDGTLTESGIGITRSAAYALEKMGLPVPEQAVLDRFVGPPLVTSFVEFAGVDEADALHATELYRERYSTVGWKENRLYAGMTPLLKALKAKGAYLGIASAKPEVFVRRIAEHFGFDRYFDKIVGIRMEVTHADKIELLREALPENYDPETTAMVGDRRFDMEAAKKLGVHTVGALYGYGTREELEASGAEAIAEDVAELREILLPGEAAAPGKFITFEGTDGCGKSTQMKLAAEYLIDRGYEVVVSREPGGCEASERIRNVVLDIQLKGISPACEALLFAAARAEHVLQVILPALAEGKIVLCDRFLDSSFAYQARGRELGDAFIRQINVTAYRASPDRTLLFKVDQAVSARRTNARGELDRLESEKDDFFQRVGRAYDALAAADPGRVHIIDSNRGIDEVFADVRADIDALLS